jgi:hypothetical protein
MTSSIRINNLKNQIQGFASTQGLTNIRLISSMVAKTGSVQLKGATKG